MTDENVPANPSTKRPSRRAVLAGLAGVGVAGVAGGALIDVLRSDNHALGDERAATPTSKAVALERGVLVLVTLYGGNDGLNTLVPYNDPVYLDARGDLAITGSDVLPIDDTVGLNASLTGLKGFWDQKNLAIVRGVGYANPNRSHFRSMDIWQSGVPDRDEPSGWIGRWLDTAERDPLRALAVGTSLPRVLRGTKTSGSVLPVNGIKLPRNGTLDAAFRSLAAGTSSDDLAAAVNQANADLLTVQQQFGTLAVPKPDDPNPTSGPGSALADQLRLVAAAIRAKAPTRVYAVNLSGFDTHAAERTAHTDLLRSLDGALTAFFTDLDKEAAADNVVAVVYSEFGRRVQANGSKGTDHGTAAPVFVLGPNVRGGFYGDDPPLTSLDQGDLRFTTDFRSVYATVLDGVLDADADRVLGATFEPLAFL